MSLSHKSDEEISELLTSYGIKHGPIVDSTRRLYEKKLKEAMDEAAVKPSSDKTYYREEEEEVTYVTYHSPVRHEGYGDAYTSARRENEDCELSKLTTKYSPPSLKRRVQTEQAEEEEFHHDKEPPSQSTRAANHTAVQSRQPIKKSGGCKSKLKWLLLLALVGAGLYYVYSCMESNPENPFGHLL